MCFLCVASVAKLRFASVSKIAPILVFNQVYNADDNVFVGAPCGSGKGVVAEFAMMRLFNHHPDPDSAKAVYITPYDSLVQQVRDLLFSRFVQTDGDGTNNCVLPCSLVALNPFKEGFSPL